MTSMEMFWAKLVFSSSSRRADFYEDLSDALLDGSDIVGYLNRRAQRAQRMKDSVGPLYRRWSTKMETSFALAMKQDIPVEEFVAIAAAERGAELPQALRFIASTIREAAKMKMALVSALSLPLVILAFVIGMLFGFTYKFVPLIASVLPPEKWPGSGKILYALSKFIESWGLLVVLGIVGFFIGLGWMISNFVGDSRRKMDEYPPFNLFRSYNGAMVIVNLATLIRSGISLHESLLTISKNGNPWIKWQTKTILQRMDVMSGNIGQAFDTGLLPYRMLNRLVDKVEQGGRNFGDALQELGTGIMIGVQREVAIRAKGLNIFMLLLAGAVLGGLIIGFLDTMYSIQNGLKVY